MENHIKILGILFIIWGVMSIFFGTLLIFLFMGTGILSSWVSGTSEFLAFMSLIGFALGLFCSTTGVAELAGGIGLLLKKKWSRIVVIIMAILNIIDIPFGTALGIYALWILFKPEAERILVA